MSVSAEHGAAEPAAEPAALTKTPAKTATQTAKPAATPEAARPRLLWPDYTRVVAIAMVLVMHTIGGTVKGSHVGSRTWWVALLIDTSVNAAVPIFAMLSGALLLAPGRWRGTGNFYRRRFIRVGIPAAAWIAIYFGWQRWVLHHPIGVRAEAKAVLAGFPYFHLYFLFVILGLYAITPFLRLIVHNIGRAELIGLTAGCLALTWFNGWLTVNSHLGSTPNALTFFLPYVGYFLAGYMLREAAVRGRWLALLAVGVVATIVGEAGESYALGGVLSPLSKYSALTIAMALLIFVLMIQVGRIAAERGWTGRIARVLSDASFGVYLLHPIVMATFAERAGFVLYPGTPPHLLATLLFTAVVSWTVIIVVRRIPVIRQIV